MSAIKRTTDYTKFISAPNRSLNPRKHAKLRASMEEYGFDEDYPILVKQVGNHFEVIAGQHRLYFAKELGLPVYYKITDSDRDAAVMESATVAWSLSDYAYAQAEQGLTAYRDLLTFVAEHDMPISYAVSILSDNANWGSVRDDFMSGKFVIKKSKYADGLATVWNAIRQNNSAVAVAGMMSSLRLAIVVPGFSCERLAEKINKYPGLLTKCSSPSDYLDLIEKLYNNREKVRFPVVFPAKEAARVRRTNVQFKGKKKK